MAPLPGGAVRRALLWRSGGQLAGQAALWAATFLVLRLLAPADYGLVAMAGIVTGFLALLAGHGFAAALVQAPRLDRAALRGFLGLLLLISLGLAALQLAAAAPAAAWFDEPRVAELLRVQALAYPLIPLAAVPAALAQRALDFRTGALIDLGASLAGAALTLALAWGGAGVWALVAGQLLPHLVRALAWPLAGHRPPRPGLGFAGARPLLRFGGAVTLNGLVWFLYAQSDVAIGGRLLDAAAIGLYSTAFFLAALPVAKLVPALTDVGLAAYARLAPDRGAVAAAFLKANRLAALIAFPLFAGLAATAPIAAPALLGAQWSAAAAPIRLLALAMPLYAVAQLMGPAVNALGRPRVQLGNALIGLALMPPAFALGAQWDGARGLAAAWALAYPWLFAIAAARSLGVIGASPAALARAIGPPALAAAAMGLAIAPLATRAEPSLAALAGLTLLGAGLYAGLVRAAWPARWRELAALLRPQPAVI